MFLRIYEDLIENHCLVWVFWVVERIQTNWNIELLVLMRQILSEKYKFMDLVKTMVFHDSRDEWLPLRRMLLWYASDVVWMQNQ